MSEAADPRPCAPMSQATMAYVRQHADDDVSMLALRGCTDAAVDLGAALTQIAGWQRAARKLPSWAATDGIVYPPHLNMEQCSSEHTAKYKAALCRRLLAAEPGTEDKEAASAGSAPAAIVPVRRLVDLTGGFGVDFSYMLPAFDEGIYVERAPDLCAIAAHNFGVLGLSATAVCADGPAYFSTVGHATLTFLDPARRDDHGARTYGIAHCTPDVVPLLPALLAKSRYVLLKLSPMLDWRKAVADLGPQNVRQVHIVSVQNECKELLVLLAAPAEGQPAPTLHCANDGSCFSLPLADAATPPPITAPGAAASVLLEPNASVMKAGCFGALAATYGVSQLAAASHLFVAAQPVDGFPGRQFAVDAATTMNKRDLKTATAHLRQANIATRNFPLSVAQLRQRLKLRDGGSAYIFATTLAAGTHVLFVCRKLA